MRHIKVLAVAVVVAFVIVAIPGSASAQGDSGRQVYTLTGTFAAGGNRKIHIFPMNFAAGDSIRAIITRDLLYGNQIDVLRNADNVTLPARGGPDYPYFDGVGVHGLIHVVPTSSGLRVTLYDVAAKKEAGSRDFALPSQANTQEWRWSLHGVSDQLHEWVVAKPGIAQTRIAFVRGGGLMVVDFDGANERRVESGTILSPAWHPTQPLLVFSVFREALETSSWQIGTKAPSGGTIRWLTNTRDGANAAPTFSRDGSNVFFQRSDNASSSIVTTPFQAGGVTRTVLTSSSTIASPDMHPDGSRILYISDALGNPTLFTMATDGARPQPLIPSRGMTSIESPVWSPDGTQIAYAARRGLEPFQIEIADVRAPGSPRLVTDSGKNEAPSWAPNSRHLVFESNRGGRGAQLYILDTKSGTIRALTQGTVDSKNAAWSPRYK